MNSLVSDKTSHVMATFKNYLVVNISNILPYNFIAVFKSNLAWPACKK